MNILDVPPDLQRLIAQQYDLPGINNLCVANPVFNNSVCRSNNFWISKLLRDYPVEYQDPYFQSKGLTSRQLYELLYSLDVVKQSFLYNGTLSELDRTRRLYPFRIFLEQVPREIRVLTNLRTLNLETNLIESLPTEIGSLTNLQVLDVSNNRLRTLPETIGNLTRLRSLDARDNPLQSIPDSINNLVNTRVLLPFPFN